jgi:hypothetical protein
MLLEAVDTNILLLEPLNYGVFNLTHSIQVCEVLLEHISIRCEILEPVVVPDIFQRWLGFSFNRLPFYGVDI